MVHLSKKTLKFLGKLAISVGLVVWIIFRVDWYEVWSYVHGIRIWQLAIYVVLYMAGIFISSLKWKSLANFKGFNYSLSKYFSLYFTGTFINNFMPSFIGGDTFKSYQIGRENGRYSEAASSVIMDRATGLLGAIILTLIFAVINYKLVLSSPLLLIIISGLIIFEILYQVIIKKNNFFIDSKLGRRVPEKIKKFIKEFDVYHDDPIIFRKSIIYSILFSLIGLAAANYVLFISMGIKIELLGYLSVIFLISIISSIPISINNIGVKEWAYITFFGLLGVSSSAVITVAILSRFLQMFISFFAFPIYLKNK